MLNSLLRYKRELPEFKTVYLFGGSFAYLNEYQAQLCPKTRNKYITPISSTEIKPEIIPGYWPFYNGIAWVQRKLTAEKVINTKLFITKVKEILGGVEGASVFFSGYPSFIYDAENHNWVDLCVILKSALKREIIHLEHFNSIKLAAEESGILLEKL